MKPSANVFASSVQRWSLGVLLGLSVSMAALPDLAEAKGKHPEKSTVSTKKADKKTTNKQAESKKTSKIADQKERKNSKKQVAAKQESKKEAKQAKDTGKKAEKTLTRKDKQEEKKLSRKGKAEEKSDKHGKLASKDKQNKDKPGKKSKTSKTEVSASTDRDKHPTRTTRRKAAERNAVQEQYVWHPSRENPQDYYVMPDSLANGTEATQEPEEQPVAIAADDLVQHPVKAGKPFQVGTASYYGTGFHGKRTASGERFDQDDLTCAHGSLPFGCRLRVTNVRNNRSVEVKVNDRGAFHKYGRVIDLSKAAAREIGMLGSGTAKVKVEILE